MANAEIYMADIARTIRGLFYQTRYTRTERKLSDNGWKEEEPYCWVDRSKRNDLYGLMLQGINPARILYPNAAKNSC